MLTAAPTSKNAGAAHEGKDENCSAMTAAPTSKNAGAAHEGKDGNCSAMSFTNGAD